MPIDTLKQIGGSASRAVAGTAPAKPAAPTARQDLPGSGNTVPPQEAEVVKQADVRQAVSRLNDYVQTLRRDLRFTVDEESGRAIVKVIDSETGELIRQIPSEEVVAISQALTDTTKQTEGIILSDKA